MSADTLNTERVRHPVKIRLLQVKRITELSPTMRRITLTGDDLPGFYSPAFDDHLKLIVPDAGEEKPRMPTLGEKGMVFPEDQPKPALRDYTPRRYDPDTNELDIDFVLDHAGPATDWANQAEPGHYIGIAGPRGSFIIPPHFDWHLLMGDETALPAIARRLEELPASTQAIVVVKTTTEAGKIELHSQCQAQITWLTQGIDDRSGTEALLASVDDLELPEGEGFFWAAAEYRDIKALRQAIVDKFAIDKSRIRASSYWQHSQTVTDSPAA